MQTLNKTTSRGLISVEALSYSYKGLEIFRDCSFTARSKTVILRGPSGCGKTTLLKLLSGNLLPDFAAAMPDSDRSCLVLQEDSLFPWLTGMENITVLTKMKESEFKRHPMFELIAGFVDRKACQMSYGQRRLVELFRAIAFRPPYLYLDEPFNFLDEERIKLVLPFLRDEFIAETNLTLSNHHREDLSCLGAATMIHFDGKFPICTLVQTDQGQS
ncbi:MAG TPA: ATP-binding cassette domain-containing protein [Planktothrix sp.]|jgi:ABC-type nitrate/sulfonate/bicarbonate transport system ATPase subunit